MYTQPFLPHRLNIPGTLGLKTHLSKYPYHICQRRFYITSLPNDKNENLSKLKLDADNFGIWPSTRKRTSWELRKVLILVSLCSPRSLTTVETFGRFCVLSDNSTLLNCHFEIIKPYWPVLASFQFLLFYLEVQIRSLFTWLVPYWLK